MITAIYNFFKDSSGKVVIVQFPSRPLLGWIVFTVLARILPSGTWQQLAGALSFASLVYWAILEIAQGNSYFRRALGIVILTATVGYRFKWYSLGCLQC
ncbi:hypothetical protein EB118_01570 [bacterium]|nr:hypothetical protein [bacterium]NBX98532.1 hypothetical protein [bacterium]NDC93832.1 hypothetical protein [bacterium]NDD84211.1 hypothetical protein [bacterium]NDG28778.1 hypothetical protein [bacterium]